MRACLVPFRQDRRVLDLALGGFFVRFLGSFCVFFHETLPDKPLIAVAVAEWHTPSVRTGYFPAVDGGPKWKAEGSGRGMRDEGGWWW